MRLSPACSNPGISNQRHRQIKHRRHSIFHHRRDHADRLFGKMIPGFKNQFVMDLQQHLRLDTGRPQCGWQPDHRPLYDIGSATLNWGR